MLRSFSVLVALLAAFPAWAETIRVAIGDVSVVSPGVTVTTVAVGDANVADVQVDGDKNVIVFGKAPGVTSIVVFDQDHKPAYSARIDVVVAARPEDAVVVRGAAVPDVPWMCPPGSPCIKSEPK